MYRYIDIIIRTFFTIDIFQWPFGTTAYVGLVGRTSPHQREDPGSIPGPWIFFTLLVIIQPYTEFSEVDMVE